METSRHLSPADRLMRGQAALTGSRMYQSFPGEQGYPAYNGGPYSGWAIPQQYGHHRTSDPGLFTLQGQSQDDSLDLSPFDHLARSSVNNVPLSDVIKPEQTTPWVGEQQRTSQFERLPPATSLSTNRYPKSEPAPKQDHFSEVADSGYQSQPSYNNQLGTTGPSPSTDFNWDKQELERDHRSHSFTPYQTDRFDIKSVVSESCLVNGAKDGRRRVQLTPCPVQGCNRMPKNLSDQRKHALTHTKPFKCLVSGCNRSDGFATENDLQRHRKSVHNLQPTVGSAAGYVCAACPVTEGTDSKFWPRRDNFKAHIKRKHSDWAEQHLIDISKRIMRPDDARTVEDDARTVRSAIQSAAARSQIDPDEDNGHQRLPPSANLARHTSDPEDALVDMQGHQADLQYNSATSMASMGTNGLSTLNEEADCDVGFHPFSPDNKMDSNSYGYQYRHYHEQPRPPSSAHLTIPETRSSSGSSNCQSAVSPSVAGGEYPCPVCHKVKSRECDLKKHMKRHTKPYGCTFPNCQKTFGSRNDWKRHESSQHFLQEMWKCQRKRADGTDCIRRPFYQLELLKRHLRGHNHQMSDELEIESECKNFRLGRDGYDHFWCGFCRDLVTQSNEFQQQQQSALEARFKHIGDHFDKDNRDGGEWVCIDENKPKRLITPEERKEAKRRARTGFREEDDGELPDYMSGFVVSPHPFGSSSAMSAGAAAATGGGGVYSPVGQKRKAEIFDADSGSGSGQAQMYAGQM